MSDRKRMKKLREKRIESIEKQIFLHKKKTKTENPVKDTTRDYWEREIKEKFKKIKEEDEKYLKENEK